MKSTSLRANQSLTVSVLLFEVVVAFLVCYSAYSEHKQELKTEPYRSSLSPIQRAELDRAHGDLALAMQDLDAVKQDSPQYDSAQSLRYQIQTESQTGIENQRTPQFETAKDDCKARVKDQEEFPSTVEFKWFGTVSTVDSVARQLTVTVDYTAKNSMGAELPYRMRCIANYDGEVTNTSRTGR